MLCSLAHSLTCPASLITCSPFMLVSPFPFWPFALSAAFYIAHAVPTFLKSKNTNNFNYLRQLKQFSCHLSIRQLLSKQKCIKQEKRNDSVRLSYSTKVSSDSTKTSKEIPGAKRKRAQEKGRIFSDILLAWFMHTVIFVVYGVDGCG